MSEKHNHALAFDPHHKGQYVELTAERTKARRQVGFCDGLVVSERFVRPGELVAVEITETERGWSGDLRVGFTLLPNQLLLPLPSLALPELLSRGQSWIVAAGSGVTLLLSNRHRDFWRRQQRKSSIKQINRLNSIGNQINSNDFNLNNICFFNNDESPRNLPSHLCVLNSTQSTNSTATITNGTTTCSNHMGSNQLFYQNLQLNLFSPCVCCLHTKLGRVPFSQLVPYDPEFVRPPDVEKGSVIAIYYELEPVQLNHSINNLKNYSNDFGNIQSLNENEFYQTNHILPIIDEENSNLDKLVFHFRFHLVINGIDLIAISENITILPQDFVHDLSFSNSTSKCDLLSSSNCTNDNLTNVNLNDVCMMNYDYQTNANSVLSSLTQENNEEPFFHNPLVICPQLNQTNSIIFTNTTATNATATLTTTTASTSSSSGSSSTTATIPSKCNTTHYDNISYKNEHLVFPRMRAVFDVYGQTKSIQLRLLEQNSITSLRRLCSCVILHSILIRFSSQLTSISEKDDVENGIDCNLLNISTLTTAQTDTNVGNTTCGNGVINNNTHHHYQYHNHLNDSYLMEKTKSHHLNWDLPSRSMILSKIIENSRFKQLFIRIDQLPLPRAERVRLQRDAFAVLARGKMFD